MQQIAEPAGRALAQLRGSSTLPESDSARCDLAWNALAEIFGPAFVNAYGERPLSLWAEAMSSMTDDELRRAFSTLIGQRRPFPPNLTEFVHAARKSEGVRYLGAPLTPAQRKALGHKPIVSREFVDGYLAKIRAALSGTGSASAPKG